MNVCLTKTYQMFQFYSKFVGFFNSSKCVRLLSTKTQTCYASMKVLNVAEKNDAAKNIAKYLSGGNVFRREGNSTYNKIYEFECEVFGQNCVMIMTSVSGHLLQFTFPSSAHKWESVNPLQLFDIPVQKVCEEENEKIMQTLQREVKGCSKVIIWTDCDREGENIGFEIIEVCKAVKPNINFYRAKFSEITYQSVKRALNTLEMPNKQISDAVDVRQELDLRIGAAFTRLQTILLRKAFPNLLKVENIISYGSCQFPTLGFVVNRFKEISEFIPEKFWQISVTHTVGNVTSEFFWERHRLFDKLACQVLYEKCVEMNLATVENVTSKPTYKWRPKPMDTITLERLASSKLKINAKEALHIAERLYSQGLISYPRTETTIFPKELDLVPLVENQKENPDWGDFARRVLKDSPNPFQGNKTDNAHPPIHPLKPSADLKGNDFKIYQLIVRHFLACLSKHAEGLETTVEINIADEKFVGKGLMITAENYLEVYPYDKWNDKQINIYRKGDNFKPALEMREGETVPPKLLTEADLIALMEKYGIGTDATHAEHIEKIKTRLYIGLEKNKYFVPRTLGMGLVEGYINMGHSAMTQPALRAELESDLKKICENKKMPDEILKKHILIYRKVFTEVTQQFGLLLETVKNYVRTEISCKIPNNIFEGLRRGVGKCPSCRSKMILLTWKHKTFVGCSGYPQCQEKFWFPSFVLEANVTEDTCPKCGPDYSLIQFKFEKKSCCFPSQYTGCIGGCDVNLREVLGLNIKKRKRSPTRTSTFGESLNDDNNDSGLGSMNESPLNRITQPKLKSLNSNRGSSFVTKTSRNSGWNSSRQFSACASINSQSAGSFYKEDDVGEPSAAEISVGFSNHTISKGEDIRCFCAIVCSQKTVQKPGKNLGRQFFSCGKSMQDPDRCNFFKWIENKENQSDNDTRSRDSNSVSFAQRDFKNQRRGKRSGAEGHNRKTWSRK